MPGTGPGSSDCCGRSGQMAADLIGGDTLRFQLIAEGRGAPGRAQGLLCWTDTGAVQGGRDDLWLFAAPRVELTLYAMNLVLGGSGLQALLNGADLVGPSLTLRDGLVVSGGWKRNAAQVLGVEWLAVVFGASYGAAPHQYLPWATLVLKEMGCPHG